MSDKIRIAVGLVLPVSVDLDVSPLDDEGEFEILGVQLSSLQSLSLRDVFEQASDEDFEGMRRAIRKEQID